MLADYPGVEVMTRLSTNLLNLSGSPLHLSKTLMNLVSNAVEAMPDGGTLTVRTAATDAGGQIVVSITDTGEGIPADRLEKIFDPFATFKDDGTGLGLATVYGIVAQSDGFIRVESEAGRGTTFTVRLPFTLSISRALLVQAGDEAFYAAWDRAEAFVDAHAPEFILLQCGADSIAGDPITHLQYTTAAHAHAARRLCALADRHCQGRLLAMGGGGYNRDTLARAWTAVLSELADAGQ